MHPGEEREKRTVINDQRCMWAPESKCVITKRINLEGVSLTLDSEEEPG